MRKKIKGTKNRPRLFVFMSNKHIYAQMIDDTSNRILTSCCSNSKEIKKTLKLSLNCKTASILGKDIAQKSIDQGIRQVVFDRGNKLYHGKIKAFAEAAREAGIHF